jgi:hypothetical protein
MTTSRATSALLPPAAGKKISAGTLGYFRARTKSQFLSLLLREFKKSGISQKELGIRLGKDPAIISRYLGAPGNWELDTVSDLFFAVSGGVLEVRVVYPLNPRLARAETSSAPRPETPATTTTTKTKSISYEGDNHQELLRCQAFSITSEKLEIQQLAA